MAVLSLLKLLILSTLVTLTFGSPHGLQDLFPRQATSESCTCPPPSTTVFLRLSTTTSTVIVTSGESGTTTITGATLTVSSISTRTATTTVTGTSTSTTCIVVPFRAKRQASDTFSGVTTDTTAQGTGISITSDVIETVTETSTATISTESETLTQNTVTVSSVTVVTATSTITPIVTSCPAPARSCNNQGIRFAVYNNTNSDGQDNASEDFGYPNFDPEIIKTRAPVYQNTTTRIGGLFYVNPSIVPIYNSSPVVFRSDYTIINHVGYIFAQLSGDYTITIDESDDITLLWVGDKAVSGWTRDNADATDVTFVTASASYTTEFQAGNYYPFRIIYGNAQRDMIFAIRVTAPDGTVILTSNSRPSPYLVQYSCDGTLAPEFPPFGSET